ncbi:hypothetical protein V2590_11605 [Tenacibaculum maritimum]
MKRLSSCTANSKAAFNNNNFFSPSLNDSIVKESLKRISMFSIILAFSGVKSMYKKEYTSSFI